MKNVILFGLINVILITSCGLRKTETRSDGNLQVGQDFEFVKFSDFNFEWGDIQDGEEILIISYSGGDNCNLETTYYKQFIGIKKTTRDTIRILAPCQIYDLDHLSKIGYYQKEKPRTNQYIYTNSYIIFNKQLTSSEKGNFKTVIGNLVFKSE